MAWEISGRQANRDWGDVWTRATKPPPHHFGHKQIFKREKKCSVLLFSFFSFNFCFVFLFCFLNIARQHQRITRKREVRHQQEGLGHQKEKEKG